MRSIDGPTIENVLRTVGRIFDESRVRVSGVIAPWAMSLVQRCNSYTEITPSGTGLRIIGRGTGDEIHRKQPVSDGVTLETYRRATRYITITGNTLPSFDVALCNIDAHIDAVAAELDGSKKKKKQNGSGATVVEGLEADAGKGISEAAEDNYQLPRDLLNMLYLQGEAPAKYPSRSELFYVFLKKALRKNIDENIIVSSCLDTTYADCSIYTHVQDNGGEDYVKRQIERAINDDEPATDDDDKRATIKVEAGKLDMAWRATQQALIDAGCPVYVRGDHLVQPLWRFEKIPQEGRDVLTAQFVRLNVPRLADIVGHHAARFFKYDKRAEEWLPVDPPRPVMETLLEVKHWHFLSVVGIINSPTMRADGSLVAEPGYDPATKLWYKPSGDITLPPIPDAPTKKQAAAALARLNKLLKGFPFDDEVARAVALAGILTSVLRGVFHAAPIFMIVAPEPRTGKTYLVQLISHIATGHGAMPIAGSDRREEMEKRIETAALSGRPILHLNNLPNGMSLESEALSQLSSEGHVMIRKLGRHEEGLCDCRATTTFVNGNNILVAADLVPRTPVCRLNANVEQPERRQFPFDPIALVRADRGAYLADCFTIARAFIAAGSPRPAEMHSVAGYEQWSKYVQQPLMWLGMADPFGSIQTTRAMDPTLEEFHHLLEVLKNYHNELTGRFNVSDCHRLAEEQISDNWSRPTYRRPDLRALMLVSGRVDTNAFGRLISKHLDRIHNGWCIKFVRDTNAGKAYRLEGPPASPVPLDQHD